MRSDYMAEVSRLANEYRALIVQARSLRADNDDVPSVDEARCYKRAVEIASRLANLSVGEARNHWMDCQEESSRKLRDISDYAMALKAKKNNVEGAGGAAPSGGSAAKSGSGSSTSSGSSAKSGEKSKGGKRGTVPQEVVDGWFADKLTYGFEAVAGMEDLIEKLRDCVRNVAVTALNQYLGMSMVHSYFMYGPPGCGKTFISKAFAYELKKMGYEYMSLSGGDIHNSLVGESEKYVERAFQEAAERAPCIMFIDEIDSVCRNRSMPNVPAHAMSTTTAFLTGYNDIAHSTKPIIFIGATNYPNLVDNAMMDRVELIKLPLPGMEVRANTFEKNLGKILQNEPGFTFEDMADMTDNYNQRDIGRLTDKIKQLVKEEAKKIYGEDEEAAVEAMKNGEFCMTREIFTRAVNGYQPSKKDDIIRSLDAWDDTQQKNQE